MNGQQLLDAMEFIDDKYVSASETPRRKKHTKRWFPAVAAAVLMLCFLLLQGGESAGLTAKAAEVSEQEMMFGATVPRFLYADGDIVIMYDYIGIWAYSIKKDCLTGFCGFCERGMTQIQGDPCVLVEATNDGKYVKFYWNDGHGSRYLYDVRRDSVREVTDYGALADDVCCLPYAENSLSDYAETRMTKDGSAISYTFDFPEDRMLCYGDLRLVISVGQKTESRTIFRG